MTFEEFPALDRTIIADAEAAGLGQGREVLVIDDASGALAAWALDAVQGRPHGRVLVYCRDLSAARARHAEAAASSDSQRVIVAGIDSDVAGLEEFLAGSEFSGSSALGRLDKSLNCLDDTARSLARHCQERDLNMHLILGANTKHMAPSMNGVLAQSFEDVAALRGRGKFRCLSASGPKGAVGPHEGERTGGVVGIGGVFSGGTPDRGGEALADAALGWLEEQVKLGRRGLRVLDLGCGNGSVSRAILEGGKGVDGIATVTATDLNMDAVRSARATLAPWLAVTSGPERDAGSGAVACVTWDSAAESVSDESVDLVLLNPPFHEGTKVDATLVGPLLDAAARVLVEGGTMLFVHNSHLRYRPQLERRFTRVTQVSRNRTFTVLRAER